MVAEQLNSVGHEARLNGPAGADIEVFQKVRDVARLREAVPHAKVIVYDFDDNYLLEHVGATHDVLRLMNVADLVTVGSSRLYEEACRFHDHVYLFENPIDVRSDSVPRPHDPWQGRLGWFGNRTNLQALEHLALECRIVTVTQGGDVEWALETVDSVVAGFDVVLIPVDASQWTLSKNANRLLKCVALRVPFLASKTPEHEEAVSALGLPNWLLVDSGDSWNKRIAEVEERFSELLTALAPARERAFERYGIEAVTAAWLDQVRAATARRPAPPLRGHTDPFDDVDVVVLNENEPHFADLTLRSLRASEVGWGSVAVVSALALDAEKTGGVECIHGHRDYFEVYSSLAQVLGTRTSHFTLLLRAGVELRRGFFEVLAPRLAQDGTILFRPQLGAPDFDPVEPPPVRLDELLLRPYLPAAVMFPTVGWASAGGIEARFGSLALWEAMIRLYAGGEPVVDCCSAPVMTVKPAVHKRHTVQSYSVFLRATEPAIAGELPGLDDEWCRLKAVLQGAVIDRHLDIFSQYASALITQLEMDRERLARRATKTASVLDETQRAYAMRKQKQQAAEDAYRRLKEKVERGAPQSGGATVGPAATVGPRDGDRQTSARPSRERALAVELANRILSADDLGADGGRSA